VRIQRRPSDINFSAARKSYDPTAGCGILRLPSKHCEWTFELAPCLILENQSGQVSGDGLRCPPISATDSTSSPSPHGFHATGVCKNGLIPPIREMIVRVRISVIGLLQRQISNWRPFVFSELDINSFCSVACHVLWSLSLQPTLS
jgi:hypothetical protein